MTDRKRRAAVSILVRRILAALALHLPIVTPS